MQARVLVIALVSLSPVLLFFSLTRPGFPQEVDGKTNVASGEIKHFPIQALSKANTAFSREINQTAILNVFVADLPSEFNYGLLHEYWKFERSRTTNKISEDNDSGSSNPRVEISSGRFSTSTVEIPPYPQNPLIKQYSAEYWLLGDLMTPEKEKRNSLVRRVWNSSLADVVFVPFFATLSAELQLHQAKGKFRHTKGNADYSRQVRVLEIVKNSTEWKRSHGRDHVFVLTDPVAMWHVRPEIPPAVLLTVDFGGWYMEDAKEMQKHAGSLDVIAHRQVSLLKDVIVPYTHLLPPLHLSEDRQRSILLYFKGARHRHRTGLVRDKLWSVLKDEPGVVFEEGFPNATGRDQALRGMRNSEFCLHPAGDTPTSCRLFDAVMSLSQGFTAQVFDRIA